MSNVIHLIAPMAAMVAVNVLGTVSLRHYSGTDRELFFILGTGAYVLGAALYVYLMRGETLAVLVMVSAILQLGLMMGLSVWMFGEQVSLVQWLGLTTGMIGLAIVLVSAPA